MNVQKLKDKILERGINVETLASKIGIEKKQGLFFLIDMLHRIHKEAVLFGEPLETERKQTWQTKH